MGKASAFDRSDKRYVLSEVRKCGLGLRHACPALKADHEIVKAAVGQNRGEILSNSYISRS